jgi:diguanylate cyclase (GGDEF)-like protein
MPRPVLTVPPQHPAARTLDSLAEHYMVLRDAARCGDLHQGLVSYLARLRDGAAQAAESTDVLAQLVDLTEDPGAPALLIAHFLLACESEADAPDASGIRARALHDLVESIRRAVGIATTRAEERARLDPASGLPTRSALYRQAGLFLAGAVQSGQQIAALCIDFQHSTRTLGQPGHGSQEDLVLAICTRLRSAVRPVDVLGRTSALEFTLLLPGLDDPDQALLAAQKIASCFAEPLGLRQDVIALTVTIGVSRFPDHANSAEGLLNCARLAAREAHRRGSAILAYSGTSEADKLETRALEARLRQAMTHSELTLHFQPQMDLHTGAVDNVEALLRWEQRPGEWINPEAIVHSAAAAGLIGSLSLWIVGAALRQVDSWSRAGIEVSVAVNLTAASLLEDDLPELIALTLSTWGVAPERLLIEITESSMIGDMERSLHVLQRLKRVGVLIAIDDFGTGYSSLAWLRQLPLDELKIDKLFVCNMLRSPEDEMIVRTVINLAHNFHLDVVAEGVEDQATQDALGRMGCDRIQGYWLSRPLPPEQCAEFLLRRADR